MGSMEEMAAKLADLLGNDESLKQISGLLSALGGGASGKKRTQEGPAPAAPDLGALLEMISAVGGGGQESSRQGPGEEPPGPAGGSGLDPKILGLLTQAMGMMNQPDPNVELLRALKPYLEGRRREKVDEAIQALRLLRLVPLLQQSGLFPGKG